MLLPISHANPAELVAALRAGHMVAALVLFDVPIALRAQFGVRCDPVDVL